MTGIIASGLYFLIPLSKASGRNEKKWEYGKNEMRLESGK